MKYLKNGKAVEVVAVLPTSQGFVVRDYIETIDEETGELYFELDDRVHIVKRVFDKAPTELIDASYEAAEKQLQETLAKISEARNELRIVEQERKAVLSKLEQMPALRRLEAWVDGKVTHFVTLDYGRVNVTPKEQMICDSDAEDRWMRGPKRLKLITLFGDSEGNLMWRANQYRDGSSILDKECHLCASEEEAKVLAGKLIDRELSAERVCWRDQLIKSADRIGHPIDQKHRDILVVEEKQRLQKELDQKKKELEEVEKQLLVLNSTPNV